MSICDTDKFKAKAHAHSGSEALEGAQGWISASIFKAAYIIKKKIIKGARQRLNAFRDSGESFSRSTSKKWEREQKMTVFDRFGVL